MMNLEKYRATLSCLLALVAFTCFACSEESGSIDTRCFDLAIEYSDMVCECEDWIAYCECVSAGSFYDYLVEPHECLDVDVPEDCEAEGVSGDLIEDCECYTIGMSWNEETEQCEIYYLTCTSEVVNELKDLIENFECPEAEWSE